MKTRSLITLVTLLALGAQAQNVKLGHSRNTIKSGVSGGTIGGGGSSSERNRVSDHYGTVAGGRGNLAGNNDSKVNNAQYATVAGGRRNVAAGHYAFIGGGFDNKAYHNYGTVGGGRKNRVNTEANLSFIGAGLENLIHRGNFGTIGGGYDNVIAYAHYAGIPGGRHNLVGIDSDYAVVGGGLLNRIGESVPARSATIAGGERNTVDATGATVGGGERNRIAAGADFATIPGGLTNRARGVSSFAAGTGADAAHDHSFVWSGLPGGITSAGDGHFVVGAEKIWFGSGGAAQYNPGEFISTSTGAFLSDGGAWTDASSRALKENFRPVDTGEILDKLMRLPISEWNYVNQPDTVRHLGPMAEEFHALFGLGVDDKSISGVDRSGVGLAAVQALAQRVRARETAVATNRARIDANAERLRAQQERLDALERRLQALEQR